MPQVLIPLAASAFSAFAGTGAIMGVSYATIAAYVVVTALSLGVSYALASMQKKPKQSPQQQTVKQAMPSRLLVYGQDKVGGALVFYETYGDTLYQVVAHCQGPIDSIQEYWLNDAYSGQSLAAGAPAPWGGHLRGESRLGALDQSAYAALTAASGGAWTPAHRLAGVASTLMICKSAGSKFNGKVWQSGVPQLRVLMRGQADIYDPRDGATRWTQNAALIIRDYLVRKDGLGVSPSRIDEASFAAFADLCGEPVLRAAGGAAPRYAVSMSVELATAEPRAVLATLLRACDGALHPSLDGKIAIGGGRWTAPRVAIGVDDVVLYDYANGSGRAAEFNRLKITCKETGDYQPVECDPWEDVADQAARGVLQHDFDAQIVPGHEQARRLAKIFAMRANPRHRLTVTVSYGAALRLWGEDNFYLTIPELGLIYVPFAIGKIDFDLDAMKGVVDCASEDPDAYDWSMAEEGAPPSALASTPLVVAIPDAPAPALAIERVAIGAGVVMARIVATVPEAAAADRAAFELRRAGDAAWTPMLNVTAFSARSDGLADGSVYEVRAAYAHGVGASAAEDVGAWSPPASLTVLANATPPASSGSSLAASAPGGLAVDVSWMTPATDDYTTTRLYLSATASFADAVEKLVSYAPPGTAASARIVASGAGTWRVFARAFNASGVGATPLGPVTVTL